MAQDRPGLNRMNLATLSFLSVGQGDPILNTSPDGKTALIDAEPSHEVVRLLRKRMSPLSTSEAGTKSGEQPDGRLIDINAASLAELESLPGVGPVIARRIVEGWPYRAVADLIRVKGIGEKWLEKIRSRVAAK
jgi:competence protein ComEA